MRRICWNGRMACAAALALFFLAFCRGASADGSMAGQFSWSDWKHPKQKVLETAFCRPNSPWAAELTKKLSTLTVAGSKVVGPAQQRSFEIGVAMALCHGGFRVAGTLYSKMTPPDQEARKKALDDAVAHESKETTSYVLPDHPDITASITPVSTSTEDGKQCAIFKDTVAEGSQNDSALNKYCRTPPATDWQPQLAI